MSNHVDFVLPGLFNLPLNEFDPAFLKTKLPALNQLLSDSKIEPNSCFEFESIIADCIGLENAQTLPFAQAYADEAADNRHRHLLCRGVHLKADMHNALVIPLEDNSTNQDDEAIILEDLLALFSEDCDLKCIDKGLWLMSLKNCVPSDCYPHYLSVIGRKANQYIEQSRQALPWYKLMNEMQMFMHQHSINQNRLATGLLPINSLWFWGAGILPAVQSNNSHWFSENKQLIRYAYSAGIRNSSISQLATMSDTEDSVIIDLSLLEALKISNNENLQTKLLWLEETIIAPVMAVAKSNRSTLRLRAGYEFDLTSTPLSTLLSKCKFWRQRKCLIDISRYDTEI
jgi:hypothetical protein